MLQPASVMDGGCENYILAARSKEMLMETKKPNCWEFEQCGLEPGGRNVVANGICPAAAERHADGIHHGKNAGRCCWIVSGTLCHGETQGTYTEKVAGCQQCGFYKLVRQEEHPAFKVFSVIIHEIHSRAAAAA